MKTILTLIATTTLLSCSKIEELTPPDQQPTHWEVHVFINKSTCWLNINGEITIMGDGKSQDVMAFKVQHLDYMYFHSENKGCALTVFNGYERTELGYVPYFQYTNRD